jgi:transcriptional regulator with XRE-family HTH domain
MTDENTLQLNRIKVVLAEQNRSGKWLAERIGKTDTTVSRWVQNKVQPSVEQLFDIAKVLGVDVKSLLNSSNDNNKNTI